VSEMAVCGEKKKVTLAVQHRGTSRLVENGVIGGATQKKFTKQLPPGLHSPSLKKVGGGKSEEKEKGTNFYRHRGHFGVASAIHPKSRKRRAEGTKEGE